MLSCGTFQVCALFGQAKCAFFVTRRGESGKVENPKQSFDQSPTRVAKDARRAHKTTTQQNVVAQRTGNTFRTDLVAAKRMAWR